MVNGYCKSCKKMTRWLKVEPHRGGGKKYLCLTRSCFHEEEDPKKIKNPVSKKIGMWTYDRKSY